MTDSCPSHKYALKVALDHTRIVFAEMDGCLPEEVPPFHPGEEELEFDQKDLFND